MFHLPPAVLAAWSCMGRRCCKVESPKQSLGVSGVKELTPFVVRFGYLDVPTMLNGSGIKWGNVIRFINANTAEATTTYVSALVDGFHHSRYPTSWLWGMNAPRGFDIGMSIIRVGGNMYLWNV